MRFMTLDEKDELNATVKRLGARDGVVDEERLGWRRVRTETEAALAKHCGGERIEEEDAERFDGMS